MVSDRLASITPADRTIRLGDTTLHLTDRELVLGAVSYLWRPWPDGPVQRRYATPEEVLQIVCPEHAFQVTEDGYQSMRAKAERLLALRNRREA